MALVIAGSAGVLGATDTASALRPASCDAPPIRIAYNYCTPCYTFAYWGDEEWKAEIERIAKVGFNTALVIDGTFKVWQETLRELGYPEEKILEFIPDEAARAWWLMDNLTGEGGPIDQATIDADGERGRMLCREMRSRGVEPILHGFVGMMPLNWPGTLPQGRWEGKEGAYERPPMLDPTSAEYARIAAIWHRNLEKVYGIKPKWLAGDLFHEGGNSAGIDVTAATRAVQAAQQAAFPGVTWIVQGWWANPTAEVRAGLDPRFTLIEKLEKDVSVFAKDDAQGPDGYGELPWVWCEVMNFGGNMGLYGNLRTLAHLGRAAKGKGAETFRGYGALSEGFFSNPVCNDLFEEMMMRPAGSEMTDAELRDWLEAWLERRYGFADKRISKAWEILGETVYACPRRQSGAVDNVMCAKPSLTANNARFYSTKAGLWYDPARLEDALALYKEVAAERTDANDAFVRDIVDVERQVLANRARALVPRLKDDATGEVRGEFLSLFEKTADAMARVPEFRLATWEERARKRAGERGVKAWRRMITTWIGDAEKPDRLNDYANREYDGLIRDYYLPRWKKFFEDATKPETSSRSLEWKFPRDKNFYEGMAFADGVTGVLAWGGGDTLKLTVGRADLWDHRGGYPWTDAQSYSNITALIRKKDKKGLTQLFQKETPSGEPPNPFMLPLGRVVVKIPGATLKRGSLDVKTGVGEIEFELGGEKKTALLAMSKASRAFALKMPDGVEFEAKAVNSMELGNVREALEKIGYKDAQYSADGFTWELPADPSVTLAFAKNGGELVIETWRGNISRISALRETSFSQIRAESETYWAKFWREGARVKVPDPLIQQIFDYGMYRFGAMTDPDGVPAGLQGPWLEDNALPPWRGDYHFNINVQECYSPAYRGGHFANMMPLFKMVCSWKPRLRENARKFAGVDGYVLPHAVSDQGVTIGGFWAGTMDHGSTAWVADMMWRYVQYSGDTDFLRREAFDFMKSAMRVYRAMMEEDESGTLAIPAGPSPEWGGTAFPQAVGRNPSFQLAAAHRLARDLIAAAQLLGEEPDAMWLDVEKRLPLASIDNEKGGILLFQGRPLAESHRHHSHMAGLFPFDILDPSDSAMGATIEKTYERWRKMGHGNWTGWCLPWAAVLDVHAARPEDAVKKLKDWNRYFCDAGHGSHHDAVRKGYTRFTTRPHIMQMDGQCAAAAAILEMMAHEMNGRTEFFKGCPPEWQDVSFENLALSDGRRVSGRRKDGRISITE